MNANDLSSKRTNGGALKPNQTHNQWMSTGAVGHHQHAGNIAGAGARANTFPNHHGNSGYHRANQWRSSSYNFNNKNSGNNNMNNAKSFQGAGKGERRPKNARHNRYYQHQFDSSTWLKDPAQHETLTMSLHDILQSHGTFEDADGAQKRLEVLNELERLISDWANKLEQNRGENVDDTTDYSNDASFPHLKQKVRLISFGSYRLGVHSPTADLDLLALCPPHVKRKDFFTSFVQCLQNDDRVTSVIDVPKAYTPVIKFNLSDIPIDMLFVSLEDGSKLLENSDTNASTTRSKSAGLLTDEPSDHTISRPRIEFQIEDSMLQGLDEASVRSLNGVRVAQYLLEIIPDKETFRKVLKTVKQWASLHGLYSNVLGFLGGINWAILVAWVCQRNPSASPPVLLKIFFHTFSKWRWPKPVILTPILKNPPPGVAQLPIWDPSCNPRDRGQLMPIVTPCFPSMNSAYNVGVPQLRRLREELDRGDKIMNEIANSKATFDLLLKENDFFKDHVHYLHISIIASNEKDHRAWFGMCESRLRILIAGLESYTTKAYPFAKFFTRRVNENLEASNNKSPGNEGEIETSFFVGLRFADGVDTVDLKSCAAEFVYLANSWVDRKEGMDLKIQHVLQTELPGFVLLDEARHNEASQKGLQEDSEEIDSCLEVNTSDSLIVATSLNDMESPDDCLASPMKKAKISHMAPPPCE